MGCGSSKNSSVVHPFSSDKSKKRNDFPQQDPPAAPASTPEPSEPDEDGGSHTSSAGGRRVATPATIAAVFAENEGLQYALRGTGMEQRVPISGIHTMEPFVRLPGSPNHHPLPPLLPSLPHNATGSSALQVYGTDSQVEFFRMLDKKIEEGPDYMSESSDHH